jgi:hypothetical protein
MSRELASSSRVSAVARRARRCGGRAWRALVSGAGVTARVTARIDAIVLAFCVHRARVCERSTMKWPAF